jgi:hypothetical protein
VGVGLLRVGSGRHKLARSFAASDRTPLPDRPLLGYQQDGVSRRQLQDVAHVIPAEVDTIDTVRQLAREEHTHTYRR